MKRLVFGVIGFAAALVFAARRKSGPDEMEEKIEQLQEKFRGLDTV